MVKKFSAFLLIAFLSAGIIRAQEPPPPVLGPGENYTKLWSASYDYQTNGSVRYLVQDPANPGKWCAIIMAQPDSTTAAGVGRHVYYSYTEDNGANWTADVIDVTLDYGFPCLTLSNGIPVIANHRSSALGTLVFKDLFFGAFGFSQLGTLSTVGAANPIWPHIAGTANGNLVVAAAVNVTGAFDGYRSTYNGSSWSTYALMPNVSGPSGNFDVSANSNGKVAILGTDYNGLAAASTPPFMTLFSSNDNGGTFNGGTEIFRAIVDGGDSLFTSLVGGFQSTWIGDELHVVMVAYNNTATTFPNQYTTEFIKPRIYHWSASTGLDLVAGRANIPNIADTITQVNMAPLTQPTITKTPTGKLVCAFTAYTWGNTQQVPNGDVLNCGEIYVSVSNDNGNTWSAPVNITNTPNVEEKHPSLAPVQATDSLRIYYLRDMKAGSWVTVAGWGAAPVYGIFKATPMPVGIKENVSQAKSYELFQNYPNPFNPTTTISYYVQKTGLVTLKVYDQLGREVNTLVNGIQSQGPKEITFDASKLSSGIYYYSITAGDFKATKKMMLIK